MDALFDRLVRRLKRDKCQQYNEVSSTRNHMKTGELRLSAFGGCTEHHGFHIPGPQKRQLRGFRTLDGAHDFVMNQPIFIEHSQVVQSCTGGKPSQ